ncbi:MULTISPECIES: acyltransferase [unclassified Nostoc]|uniref:acyltransferase family protein n=1 Tax=unclassified Nostoc TaxID=2593658 RepID=UPI002AD419C4|nr:MULTISPECIES: acyltransferase [unclassified Nostoc]MDZ8122423.1 acyltransferase [Nostoc sp. CmiVER01]MDZ8227147.1 acyltransferase [Nostoc sp. ChiVER01]
MQKKRIIVLDYLRGIGSVAVVLGHFYSVVETKSPNINYHSILYTFKDFYPFIAVHVFFLISGFVVPKSYENDGSIQNFFIKRIFRIYPSYVFALIVTRLVNNLFLIEPFIGTRQFILNLLFLQDLLDSKAIIPVVWTLLIEWKFYFLVPVLNLSIKTQYSSLFSYFACSIFVFSWCIIPLNLIQYIDTKIHVLAVLCNILTDQSPHLLIILLGTVLAKGYLELWCRKTAAIVSLITICAIFFAFFRLYLKYKPSEVVFVHLNSFIWAFCIFNFSYFLREKIPYLSFFKWLGDISYSLYIIHLTLGKYVLSFTINYIPNYPTSAICIALCLCLLLSHFIHVLIEIRFIQYAKKLTA